MGESGMIFHQTFRCLAVLVVAIGLLHRTQGQTDMTEHVVTRFIAAINSHDIDAVVALMSDNHIFVDAHGNSMTGREEMRAGWNLYFSWFPDYTIAVDMMMGRGDTIGIFGYASGTFNGAADGNNSWRIPASWKAVVSKGKVARWHVYADTKIPFDIMQRHARTPPDQRGRVAGIGGVFFKSKDPKLLTKWYDRHLGTAFGSRQSYGFLWRERNDADRIGRTELGIFGEKTKYFLPSEKPFMLNFRVDDLESLLKKLRAEGVHVEDKVESYEYGKFGWILDPEGNKIELWEPVDEPLENEQ